VSPAAGQEKKASPGSERLFASSETGRIVGPPGEVVQRNVEIVRQLDELGDAGLPFAGLIAAEGTT
jgi:hypothetical protein